MDVILTKLSSLFKNRISRFLIFPFQFGIEIAIVHYRIPDFFETRKVLFYRLDEENIRLIMYSAVRYSSFPVIESTRIGYEILDMIALEFLYWSKLQ